MKRSSMDSAYIRLSLNEREVIVRHETMSWNKLHPQRHYSSRTKRGRELRQVEWLRYIEIYVNDLSGAIIDGDRTF